MQALFERTLGSGSCPVTKSEPARFDRPRFYENILSLQHSLIWNEFEELEYDSQLLRGGKE